LVVVVVAVVVVVVVAAAAAVVLTMGGGRHLCVCLHHFDLLASSVAPRVRATVAIGECALMGPKRNERRRTTIIMVPPRSPFAAHILGTTFRRLQPPPPTVPNHVNARLNGRTRPNGGRKAVQGVAI